MALRRLPAAQPPQRAASSPASPPRTCRSSADGCSSNPGNVSCRAIVEMLSYVDGASSPGVWDQAWKGIGREVSIEGALHVSSFQVGSCMQMLGDLPLDSAPPVQHLHTALFRSTSAEDALIEAAVCLATPPDTVEDEEILPSSAITSSQLRSHSISNRSFLSAQAKSSSSSSSNHVLHQLRAHTLQGSAEQLRRNKKALSRALCTVRSTAKSLHQLMAATAQVPLADMLNGQPAAMRQNPAAGIVRQASSMLCTILMAQNTVSNLAAVRAVVQPKL